MNYYNEIKNKLIDNEVYSKIKDYSKERHTLLTYYEVGKLLLEAGKKYGDDIIGNYSKKLSIDVNKKYNSRTLRRMRQLYQFFEKQKWSPLGTKLSIIHIRQLFCLNDNNEINYYANQIEKRNLSKRQLEEIIKNKEYERLPEDTKRRLLDKENSNVVDFIKNEYPIKLGSRYNYIDLLLYNIKFKCYVVVELKVTELKKDYIGQILTYMNYIDKNIKSIEEDKTIGIIICKKNNKFIMEYCSDDRILSKEYELV